MTGVGESEPSRTGADSSRVTQLMGTSKNKPPSVELPSSVLLVGEYPGQRASIARYLVDHQVLEGDHFAQVARRAGRGSVKAIIVLVQQASDLDAVPTGRVRGGGPPMLVIAPSAHASVANRAQLLDAQCLFGPDIDEHIRAFVARLRAVRRETPRAAEELATRYAHGIELSRRQREILVHVAGGVRRGELARAMGVSEATIKTIARLLLRRLGARHLDEVAIAMLRGEVAQPGKVKRSTGPQRAARKTRRKAPPATTKTRAGARRRA